VKKYKVRIAESIKVVSCGFFKDKTTPKYTERDIIINANSSDEAFGYVENMIEMLKAFRISMFFENITSSSNFHHTYVESVKHDILKVEELKYGM